MRAVFKDGVVERINDISNFWRRTGSDFLDFGERVDFVTRIDSFRTIAAEEVLVKFESAVLLKYRNTVFFGTSRVNGGFVDNDVPFVERFTDGLTRFE